MTENKEFWKTVKPILSDKSITFPKISLVEKGELISDESKVTTRFSNFFENVIGSLSIKTNENFLMRIIVSKVSLRLLLRNLSSTQVKVVLTKILLTMKFFISHFNFQKKRNFNRLSTRRLKDASNVCSPILAYVWNKEILLNTTFAENLKLADVTLICKKKDETFVES